MISEPTAERLIAALDRLTAAIEARPSRPPTMTTTAEQAWAGQVVPMPPPAYAPEPIPVSMPGGACPEHGTPWELVPAGVSGRTGRAYAAFWVCSTYGCHRTPQAR
jgi:hypothetical protein